ncbi:hypothetical protein [Nocardiopsis ganjiahuensis]|uniref:hypothetical protein n=1 Tax=Nocardiopsis ganjiahuensis TaxID=239984 RepID=UPI00034D31DB|nr:hypothetical protein [Nocardiopsis ganjiahuensis]
MADPTSTAGDRSAPGEPEDEGVEVSVQSLPPAEGGPAWEASAVTDDERLGTVQRNQLFEAMGDTPETA